MRVGTASAEATRTTATRTPTSSRRRRVRGGVGLRNFSTVVAATARGRSRVSIYDTPIDAGARGAGSGASGTAGSGVVGGHTQTTKRAAAYERPTEAAS